MTADPADTTPPPESVPHGAGDPLPPLPSTPPGRYRHYKGGEYLVLGCVRHSETLAPLVLYRPLYGAGGDWVRPHAMFFESVVIDGVRQPRFTPIGDAQTRFDSPAAASTPGG